MQGGPRIAVKGPFKATSRSQLRGGRACGARQGAQLCRDTGPRAQGRRLCCQQLLGGTSEQVATAAKITPRRNTVRPGCHDHTNREGPRWASGCGGGQRAEADADLDFLCVHGSG